MCPFHISSHNVHTNYTYYVQCTCSHAHVHVHVPFYMYIQTALTCIIVYTNYTNTCILRTMYIVHVVVYMYNFTCT